MNFKIVAKKFITDFNFSLLNIETIILNKTLTFFFELVNIQIKNIYLHLFKFSAGSEFIEAYVIVGQDVKGLFGFFLSRDMIALSLFFKVFLLRNTQGGE